MSSPDCHPGVPFLVGSVHKFSPGYGYGVRMPTVRNEPTLPASVPKYRYPPMTTREENMSKSMTLDVSGPKAIQRNKDQMMFQTSGDYGSFLFTPLNRPETTQSNRRSSSTSSSARSLCGSLQPSSSDRSLTVDVRKSSRKADGSEHMFSPINTSGVRSDPATISQYRKKDPLVGAFSRQSAYDLLASRTRARESTNQGHFHALGNKTAAGYSRDWQLGLRPHIKANLGRTNTGES